MQNFKTKKNTQNWDFQDFEMEAKTHVFPGTMHHSYEVNWKKTLAFYPKLLRALIVHPFNLMVGVE